MAPVPAKTLRLSELDESDRTAYFSVTALMERGKAVAARSEPAAAPSQSELPPAPLATEPPHVTSVSPEATPNSKPSILQQLRDASLPRKASLVMLPLLIGLLALNPVFKNQPDAAGVPEPSASPAPVVPLHVTESAPLPLLAPTPAQPPPALPKGVTLERAASDALAAGDFPRALGFYRQLSRERPQNAAFNEAVRVLERRVREQQP